MRLIGLRRINRVVRFSISIPFGAINSSSGQITTLPKQISIPFGAINSQCPHPLACEYIEISIPFGAINSKLKGVITFNHPDFNSFWCD